MSEGWGYDGGTSDTDTEDGEEGGFAADLQRAVDNGTLETLPTTKFALDLANVSDTALLKQAYQIADRDSVVEYLESRLDTLDVDPATADAGTTSETTAAADGGGAAVEAATGDDTTDSPEPPESAESGPSDDESAADEAESVELESTEEALTDEDDDGSDDAPDDVLEEADELVAEMNEADGEGGTMPDDDPFADLADGAFGRKEAEERDVLYRVMPWGREETGKTHFALTMPQPIAFIDTEGKAADIAGKFEGHVQFWEVEDYGEAVEAMESAFEYLGAWLSERDRRGTLVVDSMSDLWDWAQEAYVERYYTTAESADDVNFSSAMEGGADDWKEIKRLHNAEFRRRLVDSDFHLCLTAKATEAYGAVIEGEASTPPDKPAGEKENVYKVNHVLHLQQQDGRRVGTLEKSGLTKYGFADLTDPTFSKMRDIVEDIRDAEEAPTSIEVASVTDYEVEIGEGISSRGVTDE